MNKAVVNTLLGGSTGGLIPVLWSSFSTKKWPLSIMINGALAGNKSLSKCPKYQELWRMAWSGEVLHA